jgi:hypothetical protein
MIFFIIFSQFFTFFFLHFNPLHNFKATKISFQLLVSNFSITFRVTLKNFVTPSRHRSLFDQMFYYQRRHRRSYKKADSQLEPRTSSAPVSLEFSSIQHALNMKFVYLLAAVVALAAVGFANPQLGGRKPGGGLRPPVAPPPPVAAAPVAPVKPPVAPVAAAPVKPAPPAPVAPVRPAPVAPVRPAPVAPVAPAPVVPAPAAVAPPAKRVRRLKNGKKQKRLLKSGKQGPKRRAKGGNKLRRLRRNRKRV